MSRGRNPKFFYTGSLRSVGDVKDPLCARLGEN